MKLIDTHTHLYLDAFTSDLEDVVKRARQIGVAKHYMPGIDSKVTADMLRLEQLFPGEFIPMAGLHPCSVKENFLEELEHVQYNLASRPFAAVGEIGLDFYWDSTFREQQFIAFRTQMGWALDSNLPIVIHTRNAMRETIDAVKPFADRGLSGIFHCFGDSAAIAREITDMGFYLGIGGVVTYKKAGLDVSLQDVPLDNIVLETDAPYLAPVPYRGKRNESAYLLEIAQKLAEIKGLSLEEVASITTANAEKIFGR